MHGRPAARSTGHCARRAAACGEGRKSNIITVLDNWESKFKKKTKREKMIRAEPARQAGPGEGWPALLSQAALLLCGCRDRELLNPGISRP